MTIKKLLFVIILALLVINISDFFDLVYNNDLYPFGSDFFSEYSIYRSSNVYFTYIIIGLILSIFVTLSFKKKYFYLLSIFTILYSLYPIIVK